MQPTPRYRTGDKIGGQYLVHQALMGGMGEVYLCLDLERRIPLALKTFQARFLTNQRLREAFKTEVTTWIALGEHPNIVRVIARDDKGDLNGAIADFDKAIAINPKYAKAYALRGLVKLQKGQDQEAGQDLAKALKLDPQLRPAIEERINDIQQGRNKQPNP